MRRIVIGACVGLSVLAGFALARSPAARLPTFPSEEQAQQRCPGESVVWLNLPSWNGGTDIGGFVCKSKADRSAFVNSL